MNGQPFRTQYEDQADISSTVAVAQLSRQGTQFGEPLWNGNFGDINLNGRGLSLVGSLAQVLDDLTVTQMGWVIFQTLLTVEHCKSLRKPPSSR